MLSNTLLINRTDFSRCPYYNSGNCYANDNKICYSEKNNLSYENCHLMEVNLNSLEQIAKIIGNQKASFL